MAEPWSEAEEVQARREVTAAETKVMMVQAKMERQKETWG